MRASEMISERIRATNHRQVLIALGRVGQRSISTTTKSSWVHEFIFDDLQESYDFQIRVKKYLGPYVLDIGGSEDLGRGRYSVTVELKAFPQEYKRQRK